MYGDAFTPPTRAGADPKALQLAVVTIVQADGTVDLRMLTSRGTRVGVPVLNDAALERGDRVVLAHLDAEQQQPLIVGRYGGGPAVIPGHTHPQSDITGLVSSLAAKAPLAHTHVQGDVTNLVSDLAAKAPLASPVFTGTPTAPTPSNGDNSTKIATTAFVLANAPVFSGSHTGDITARSSGTVPAVIGNHGNFSTAASFWRSGSAQRVLGATSVNTTLNAEGAAGTMTLQRNGTTELTLNSTAAVFLRGITAPSVSADIARIGPWSGGATYAAFGHTSRQATNDYALIQATNGETFLNSAAGLNLNLRRGNADELVLGSAAATFTRDVRTAGVVSGSGRRLGLAGLNGGAGIVEAWDRLSVSQSHGFGAFPDPGAGGIYAHGPVIGNSTVVSRSSGFLAQPAGASQGSVGMVPGTGARSGYLQWFTPNGTRQAYMGFNTDDTGVFLVQEVGEFAIAAATEGAQKLRINATGIGYHGAAPVAKPTITGSRGGNAALASLLTELAATGFLLDSTTA